MSRAGRGGLKLARGSSPLQGLWPFLPLPRGVQTAQLIASGETWSCGLQGWEPVGVGCWDSSAWAGQLLLLGGAQCWGSRGAPGHWHCVELLVVAWAICQHPALGGEVHSGSFRSGVCCSTSESLLLCSVLAVVSCIVQ